MTLTISVPATSANLGPGFDSVGLAVSRFLKIEVLNPLEKWVIHHDLGSDVPSDENNLLIQTALQVEPNLTPHEIKMTSDIPLARGLGSSSSVIVAGIELANQLAHLALSDAEKLAIASEVEGHPDNVAPAILGGLVIAHSAAGETHYVAAKMPETGLLAFIPDYELKTSDSRNALPDAFDYKASVAASSVANVAIAALLTGDMTLAGQLMSQDKFHEPYRRHLVPEFEKIRTIASDKGAYVTYLSGAGPTVMVLATPDKIKLIKAALEREKLPGQLVELSVDTLGVKVEN